MNLKSPVSKANTEVIYCKHSGIKGWTAFPDDLFEAVKVLANVALGRTDEKGVTENQQRQHPELCSQLGMKPFTAPGS